MAASVLSRPVESEAVADFLDHVSTETAALLIEGEPGIGKTTVWLAAVDSAIERQFQVLSARPAPAESVLAYAALADILSEVPPDVWVDLPAPQRLALDRMLLRAGADGLPTDPRAIAAGFLSLVKRLEEAGPVLLAVDDLQWLDSSSRQIVAFAARRLSGRVGVLGTVRTVPEIAGAAWLQLPNLAGIRRITLGPLSLGSLREVVTERLGRSFSRPTMVRIYEVSQGNPFYALELARVVDDRKPNPDWRLPGTLAELVRARIGSLSDEVRDALLAASCIAAPTVELVARATGADAPRTADLLVDAEDKGIVEIDGHRLSFTHPLLAKGVYTAASPARRRAMHRNLAEIVEEPELQARHLAMAVVWGDPYTLECLDRAAHMASARGAPAAAAELLDLAVGLGGGTAERRVRSARHHFDAGDFWQAHALLEQAIDQVAPGPLRAEALGLLATMNLLNGNFMEAADLLERALIEAERNPALRVPMLVTQSLTLFNIGQPAAAAASIEDAVAGATRSGQPHLLSQALTMRERLRMISGGGLNEGNMRRALHLEDHQAPMPAIFRPSTQNAFFLAWMGRLEEARGSMRSIRQRCIERGEENDLIFIAAHTMLIEMWSGDFTEAAVIAKDTMERALHLGGEAPLSLALTMRSALAAYAGRPDVARLDAKSALAAKNRGYSNFLAEWPITILGFLEVSLGNYETAIATLRPLLSRLDMAPEGTEIWVAGFLPDLVEALVGVGRLEEAEPLVAALERNGQRLDRAWMLAVGARCRAMLLSARGDRGAARLAAAAAMVEHARLPMPFERARTELLLGQLERRQRHREAAATTLRAALDAFDAMGIPLWADRARTELARTNMGPGRSGTLSESEQQVAELAATGMTNRDVAAALFISPKTVEANLARIYRKLDIHSRAELGRVMGRRAAKLSELRHRPDAPPLWG